MKANPTPESDAGAQRAARPRSVDLALGAIVLRCVLALASAFALFGAKDEVRRNAAELHPEWSPATVVQRVDSELRSNVLLTVIYIGLVLLIAKFIRDGRNWARWLYAVVAFLIAGDVLRVTGFFTGDNVLFRLLSGFTGVAAIVAIVLLFSSSSTAYFRPAGSLGSASPLGALFGRRAATAANRDDAGRPSRRTAAGRTAAGRPDSGPTDGPKGAAAEPVSLAKPAAKRNAGRRPNGSARPAPRAKSRKQTAE